jgi:hypothetical protein
MNQHSAICYSSTHVSKSLPRPLLTHSPGNQNTAPSPGNQFSQIHTEPCLTYLLSLISNITTRAPVCTFTRGPQWYYMLFVYTFIKIITQAPYYSFCMQPTYRTSTWHPIQSDSDQAMPHLFTCPDDLYKTIGGCTHPAACLAMSRQARQSHSGKPQLKHLLMFGTPLSSFADMQ